MGWPGPMTGRQLRAWEAFYKDDWNRPDRTDHYLMQVAQEVRRGSMSKGMPPALDRFKIRFEPPAAQAPKPPALTPEQETARSKGVWMALLGMGPPPDLHQVRIGSN